MMLRAIVKAGAVAFALLVSSGSSLPISSSHIEVHETFRHTSDRPASASLGEDPLPDKPLPVAPVPAKPGPNRLPPSAALSVRPVPAHPTAKVEQPQFVAPLPHSTSPSPTKCHDGEPAIIVKNTSPASICYMVELNPASKAVDLDDQCDSGNGFHVPAGNLTELCPGNEFVGALTAFHSSGLRGARFEINFSDQQHTFYDVDYEMGLDNATLGPANGEPRVVDGGNMSSLAGEVNVIARINEAFQKLDDEHKRQVYVEGYIKVNDNGDVNEAKMDKDAPPAVVRFLQLDAKLNGYVFPGSGTAEVLEARSTAGEMGKAADAFTWSTRCRRMVLTAY